MADYKIVDAEKLDADLTSVANAIRKRAGTTEKMEFPTGFENAVESIPSGGAELPALENPGSASDVASGKQLIDQYGNVVDGTLKDGGAMSLVGGTPSMYIATGGTIGVKTTANADADRIVRAGDAVSVVTAYDKFGDAKPEDVVKGKTFTSASGLTVAGTHECEEGASLPELTNPASASDMASGKELIDQDGNVVTGTLAEVTEGKMLGANQNKRMYHNGSLIRVAADTTGEGIVRPGATLMVDMPASEFGDATPADVVKGKTFTSASGLLVEGEREVQSFTVTDDGAGNVTITSSAITDNDGNVVIE